VLYNVAPTAKSDFATVKLRRVDGRRQQFADDAIVVVRIWDGDQNLPFDKEVPSDTEFKLHVFDSLRDNYAFYVARDGLMGTGFRPVHVTPGAELTVSLMLIRKNAGFEFSAWEEIEADYPAVANVFKLGGSDQARARYERLAKDAAKHPVLASLLNIVTAMQQINLPVGTPLTYLRELEWNETMAQDRFFAYADLELLNQVRQSVRQKRFAPELCPAIFHPSATCSYKQVQFGEANVQLTFHENTRREMNGIQCCLVEPDIDDYKDIGSHTICEVIPNTLGGKLTDPRTVYVLRWIASCQAGVPEFCPPYRLT
jgi:hypothetical protein